MKKLFTLLTAFIISFTYAQEKPNPLVILDAKNIGTMDKVQNILEPINPNDISTVTVIKGENAKKYSSDTGVIIITTKKYILDTFYKNNIENSPLKNEISTPENLSKIGIIGSKPESKNLPYDELVKYIDTKNIDDIVLKIAAIHFIKPSDAQKINQNWKFGAIEISPSVE